MSSAGAGCFRDKVSKTVSHVNYPTGLQDPMLLNTIRKEISILQRVSFDRNVVQFYGAWLKDAAHAMLVMEFCEVSGRV